MILINTARGPVVDIDALHDAMKDGTVQAAGLDVLPEEPANPQRRLIAAWQKNEDWIRHRLLLTPHSAFYTPESIRDNRGFARPHCGALSARRTAGELRQQAIPDPESVRQWQQRDRALSDADYRLPCRAYDG